MADGSTLATRPISLPANLLPVALIAGLCALTLLASFVTVAPNRLVSGTPLGLWAAAGPVGCLVLALLAAIMVGLALRPAMPSRSLLQAVASAGIVVALVATAGFAATTAMTGASALTRVSLGAGFWIWFSIGMLVFADATGRVRSLGVRVALVVALFGALIALAMSGALVNLSLAHEFLVHRDTYLDEVQRHLLLTTGGLLVALPLGSVLGAYALRRPGQGSTIFAVLNLIQTIPSIALFAILISPLTALVGALPALRTLGFGGIGAFPAIIALSLYALLPVARGVHAAFQAVPASAISAGRGMGMTGWQINSNIVIPLAMPTLLQMLRVVIVQLIGLTVLTALIGAGGLGTFIFNGLGQTAADLVLLGALSTIAIALVVHLVLQTVTNLLTPQGRR